MEIYILENSEIKEVQKPVNIGQQSYEFIFDEETNKTSWIYLKNSEYIKTNNLIYIMGFYKPLLFIIDNKEHEKNTTDKYIKVYMKDILNICDIKVFKKDELENEIVEQDMYNYIKDNLNNLKVSNVNLNKELSTNTKANVYKNAEQGIFNLHTYLNNARQYRSIVTDIKLIKTKEQNNNNLDIKIYNAETKQKPVNIILNTEMGNNIEIIKNENYINYVEIYITETKKTKQYYLITNKNTGRNKTVELSDYNANRFSKYDGYLLPEKIQREISTVDKEDKADESAYNIFRGNNYKHLIEFDLPVDSKLVDVNSLKVGYPVIIKAFDSVYETYISAITITNKNLIHYKSGQLRQDFTDKMLQENQKTKTIVSNDVNNKKTADETKEGTKGEKGDKGDSITIIKTEFMQNGDTMVYFSDGTIISIPKGDKGEQGEKGETGDTGAKGEDITIVKSVKEDNGDTTVYFSDKTKIVIPRGEKGDKGDKGEQGIRGSLVFSEKEYQKAEGDTENLIHNRILALRAIANYDFFLTENGKLYKIIRVDNEGINNEVELEEIVNLRGDSGLIDNIKGKSPIITKNAKEFGIISFTVAEMYELEETGLYPETDLYPEINLYPEKNIERKL